jgi:ATP-grasp domain
MDVIALIGVPWNAHELGPAAQDAEALGTALCLVDSEQALAKVPGDVRGDRLAVPAMDAEHVARALRDIRPAAVVSITEFRLTLAAQVRELLGRPGTSSAAELAVSDKLRTRQRLAEAGLTSVRFWSTPLAGLRETISPLDFPLVVKPRAFAGSNGVRMLSGPGDADDVLAAFDVGAATAADRDGLLIESFIPGAEVSAEGLVVDGKLTVWSLTDKVNTGPPYFQEVGHVMPSRESAVRHAEVQDYLQRVVVALGIETAPIHAELMLQDGGVELVEIHTRFGGGNIVRLLTETLSCRPFRSYFSALLSGETPTITSAGAVWGVGHFTARVGAPFTWSSYAFPHPQAVREIDLDASRTPKVREVEGIRIRYWRAGHVLFSSGHYDEVSANVRFMLSQF